MVTISLTQGLTTVIDDEDAALVLRYDWIVLLRRRTAYAATQTNRKIVAMHTLIMNPGPGLEVDHINGDGLCNLRSNLRVATRRQNKANSFIQRNKVSSRFKGVAWREDVRHHWTARINKNGKSTQRIAMFESEVDAAFAYDMEALDVFGEFARPNFIESVELYREIRRLPHSGQVCFGSLKGLV